jgi:DNA (cytosine-5)-methyltransferase 1
VETIAQLSWLESLEADKSSSSYFIKLLHLFDITDNLPGWPDAFGSALKAWVKDTLHVPIRTLSLFSGGGGLDIAFHDAGFNVTHMIEIDSRYAETLSHNAKEGKRLEGAEAVCVNIKDFNPPDDLNIDFIIGGPPCQTFSAAGRRAAGVPGLDDPRGNLFQEYVRIVKKLQPKGFLFENVYGILGAQGGKPWKSIVTAFESAGYKISFRILDAADYGVPQQRERLIIVGARNDYFAFPCPTHGPDSLNQHPYYTSGLAVRGAEGTKLEPVRGRYGHLLRDIPPGLNYSFYTEKMGHPSPIFSWRSKFSDLLYKADPDMPVRTIKAQGGQYTGPFHWENRPFSIEELKRLQTFPDDYDVIGGRQVAIQQIGNSVPPQFGRILAISILHQLFGVPFPFDIEVLSPHEELGFRKRKAELTAYYQQKAKEAIARQHGVVSDTFIENQKAVTPKETPPGSFMAYLGPNFVWGVKDNCDHDYPWNIQFSITQKEQLIEFHISNAGDSPKSPQVVIEIYPTEAWIIPAKSVRLLIQSPSLHLFTASWKAFEHYLVKERIKADLVQLNGYYQYKPALSIKLLVLGDATLAQHPCSEWAVIHHVLEARGVRYIISLSQLGKLWDLPLNKTIYALRSLRAVGYEVRSQYTNNQIPAGHILIPYAFPTLNPLSVQLRKVLFPDAAIEQIINGENRDEQSKLGI